jgi:beta-lactamase superfamily II metal-dependent hydrolase
MIDRLSVRMYEVGFGDCFLLRFWSGASCARVLIDCGSITEGQAQVDRVAQDVIAACRDPDGVARLSLVVATHRHKDHVGGFANPAWAQVAVDAVWMPWTEDPDDPQATYVRTRQSSLAASLAPADRSQDPLAATAAPPNAAFDAMALNALTNEKAMATLHGGFGGRVTPAFLPLKDTVCEGRPVPGIDGLTAYVLGPPRDPAALAAMDPPVGQGYFTDLAGPAGAGQAFAHHWRVDEPAYRGACPGSTFSADDIRNVIRSAEQPQGALAAALDNAVNNTSLILVFEIAGQHLLFPGDAQWGAWNAALQQPACRALLGKTSFLKVGHHGSHNATPVELVDQLLAPGFTAMFSTRPVPQWPDIPRAPLVQAIAAKASRYARSDQEAAAAAAGFHVEPGLYVEFDIPLAAPPPAAAPAVAAVAAKPATAAPDAKPKVTS